MTRNSSFLLAALATGALLVIAMHGPPVGAQISAPIGDEFDQRTFTAPFVVDCETGAVRPCPDPQSPTTWSLNGAVAGQLQITTQAGSRRTGTIRNTVLQPFAPVSNWTVTVKLALPLTGIMPTDTLLPDAGILIRQDDLHFISLSRYFHVVGNVVRSDIQFSHIAGQTTVWKNRPGTASEASSIPDVIYLRITKLGTSYHAFYSYDNKFFNPVTASSTDSEFLETYRHPKVGVFAAGGLNRDADFDWFRIGDSSAAPSPPGRVRTSVPPPPSTPAPTPSFHFDGITVLNGSGRRQEVFRHGEPVYLRMRWHVRHVSNSIPAVIRIVYQRPRDKGWAPLGSPRSISVEAVNGANSYQESFYAPVSYTRLRFVVSLHLLGRWSRAKTHTISLKG